VDGRRPDSCDEEYAPTARQAHATYLSFPLMSSDILNIISIHAFSNVQSALADKDVLLVQGASCSAAEGAAVACKAMA
jgi:hypothetical protein